MCVWVGVCFPHLFWTLYLYSYTGYIYGRISGGRVTQEELLFLFSAFLRRCMHASFLTREEFIVNIIPVRR